MKDSMMEDTRRLETGMGCTATARMHRLQPYCNQKAGRMAAVPGMVQYGIRTGHGGGSSQTMMVPNLDACVLACGRLHS